MKQILNPSLEDLRLECVLMQAWKKTSSYQRTHSWYADTLGIDYQSLRIPAFLAEIQEGIDSYATWTPELLELVPAPKTQRWCLDDRGNWIPQPNQDYQKQLRPLAHVALRDQVVATAIMLCLADRIETRMNDTRLLIDSEENRRRVLIDFTDPGRRTSRELHRHRDAAGAARAALVHQLARRQSGRGGRQAARRRVTRHAIA